jgi:hypothetical protein
MFGDYDKAPKATVLRRLVINGAVKDGSLFLAGMASSSPNVCPKVSTGYAAGAAEIDPTALLGGLRRYEKVSILRFLASLGLSDDQIMPFFRRLEWSDRTPVGWKAAESFEGQWRLTMTCALESSHDEETFLKLAVLANAENLLILKRLEEFGASVEVADPRNRTVLSLAAESGNVDVVRYLLSRNISTETLDKLWKDCVVLGCEI